MLSGHTCTYNRVCGERWFPETDSKCKVIGEGTSLEHCMEILEG